MTFEEFFTKKRIDLTRLRQAMPDLYEEFHDHYVQMGEKSFDHTKKYWFNRLRKDFLLAVVETPKATVGKAAAAKPAESSSMSPAGFKPRFKAGSAIKKAEGTLPDTAAGDKPPAPATKPAGFKPRFKPGVTKAKKETTASPGEDGGEQEPSARPVPQAAPLGFKPRFKAGVTPAKKPETERKQAPRPDATAPAPDPSTEAAPKPQGFKPRFKAGKTANKKDDTDS